MINTSIYVLLKSFDEINTFSVKSESIEFYSFIKLNASNNENQLYSVIQLPIIGTIDIKPKINILFPFFKLLKAT